jgi:hypothetical protein
MDGTWVTLNCSEHGLYEYLKGQSHENVGELGVWGISLGSN